MFTSTYTHGDAHIQSLRVKCLQTLSQLLVACASLASRNQKIASPLVYSILIQCTKTVCSIYACVVYQNIIPNKVSARQHKALPIWCYSMQMVCARHFPHGPQTHTRHTTHATISQQGTNKFNRARAVPVCANLTRDEIKWALAVSHRNIHTCSTCIRTHVDSGSRWMFVKKKVFGNFLKTLITYAFCIPIFLSYAPCDMAILHSIVYFFPSVEIAWAQQNHLTPNRIFLSPGVLNIL